MTPRGELDPDAVMLTLVVVAVLSFLAGFLLGRLS